MTNATKAIVVTAVNSLITFSEAFGIYDFTEAQTSAVLGLWNVAALVWVVATFRRSRKRLPDAG